MYGNTFVKMMHITLHMIANSFAVPTTIHILLSTSRYPAENNIRSGYENCPEFDMIVDTNNVHV